MRYRYFLLLALFLAGSLWLLFGGAGEEPDDVPGREPPHDGRRAPDAARDADANLLRCGTAPKRGESDRDGARGASLRPSAWKGRVVDDRRVPVIDASVELRVASRVLVHGSSDVEGRYLFHLPPGLLSGGTGAALFAHTSDGRGAMTPVVLVPHAGREQTLPVLVVRRSFDLDLRVVYRESGVPGARVAAVRRELMFPYLLAGQSGDEEGRVRLRGLPAGPIELFATAPGLGRGMVSLRLPRGEDAAPVTIELTEERELSVQVIDGVTQRPVSGADVVVGDSRTMPPWHGPGYLPALPRLRTNRKGHAVVRMLAATETAYVHVRARGYVFAPWWQSKSQVAAPAQREVRVALTRPRRVRFLVGTGDVPVPDEGTALSVRVREAGDLRGRSGISARMERGDVVVEGLAPGVATGTLIAPSGAQAAFFAAPGATDGQTLTFRLPRTLRVRVIDTHQGPVRGLALGIAPGARGSGALSAVTDEAGMASFDVLGQDPLSLHELGSDGHLRPPPIATLDPGSGSEIHEVVLPVAVRLVLALLIDGVARLPADYTLLAAGRRVDPAGIEEDPVAGRLACDVRSSTTDGVMTIELHAPGFLPETIEADPSAGTFEQTLDLRRDGRLVAWVIPPQGSKVIVELQRHDASRAVWIPLRVRGLGANGSDGRVRRGPEGTYVYDRLAPGRYRVLDRRSREASEGIELAVGGDRELRFDLSGGGSIHGRVIGPAGTNLTLTRVLVEGRDDASKVWSGVRPGPDGTFLVHAYRDDPLTLRVIHPTLAPAEPGGLVKARAGDTAVELRLEQGPDLRFRVAGLETATTPTSGRWRAPVAVYLVSDEATDHVVHAVQPIAKNGVFRTGCVRAGRYSLWILFQSEHAPYVKRGLELSNTPVDLGTVTPARGATLRIELEGSASRPSASIRATVTHADEPVYTCDGAVDGAAWVSHGLGPGRFRVVVEGMGLGAGVPGAPARRVLMDRIVTSDGEHDQTLRVHAP